MTTGNWDVELSKDTMTRMGKYEFHETRLYVHPMLLIVEIQSVVEKFLNCQL